ncbi:MAG TPA: T9SS type A sorting domain-containing protein [Catalimonadaceae bacterium]|nr:T9SS type A sorting domain-containing protein [Catalimonadaceae bacterium]
MCFCNFLPGKIFYRLIFVFSLLVISKVAVGQTLAGSAGGTISSPEMQVDFSIGEPVFIAASSTEFTVNIGFQQPNYDFFTSILMAEMASHQLFPNPFSDAFRFESSAPIDHYFLFDALGKEVANGSVSGREFVHFSHSLPKGMYNLQIQLLNGERLNLKLVCQ